MARDLFVNRHVGVNEMDKAEMLKTIGVSSVDELINKTIPENIRLKKPLNLPEGLTEMEYLNSIKSIAAKNKVFKSYIGLGYHETFIPQVILRNVFENPGWYTAYTPYQAEISQGRLEALLNFQTMVMDFTGMELANASLLDEGTAAGEAMLMFYNTRSRAAVKAGASKFFVSDKCFPQTIDILKTRSNPMGIELIIGDYDSFEFTEEVFGAVVQYPDERGNVKDYSNFIEKANAVDAKVAVGADLMSLVLLTPPGEWGADVVFGNTQRFGVPMGHGGPHAAYFATLEKYKRHIPGRIIGVSVDAAGNKGLRMALQTREQHIKRDKATSNICTAQALLAVMAGMYTVYHGPKGMQTIAEDIHSRAVNVAEILKELGYTINNDVFFDTIEVTLPEEIHSVEIRDLATEKEINFRYMEGNKIGISFGETITVEDLNNIIGIFAAVAKKEAVVIEKLEDKKTIPSNFERTSPYLEHEIFNSYHSETEMMRYLKKLENKDLSLTHSMIPLGSCTMKLNAVSELSPLSWPEFSSIHPFAPIEQVQGYLEIFKELEGALCEITGFAGMSLQPNSGAQGEYAGLMVIRAYHENRNEGHRNICLIPSSAHGTNPASAVMAGMKVVVTKCDENGNIDIDDLRAKAEEHADNLSAFMVTYPSTHGVYEKGIKKINDIIHDNGGQVYMDGANMNAQVGLTNPGNINADVCHLNLHKTFAIPHGGGGPGMGPIGVAEHLKPFLPGHAIVKTGGDKAINAISAAPWGSSLILIISYAYIKMLGREGLKQSTEAAILNANYIKQKLSDHYNVLYTGENNTVAHEMILDCRAFKKIAGVEVADIAKRLIDFGFHAPTVAFPVADTLMVEPTESESIEELDRFCESMIKIREEISMIEKGMIPVEESTLKNAPHTSNDIVVENWDKPYTREEAVFPLSFLREAKFWPSVKRIDNAYGDRNLICSCPSIESYEEEFAH